jgi:hypothetical protein
MSKSHDYSKWFLAVPVRRRPATVAIAFLVVFHGAAQTVLASCGDYVMLGGSHVTHHSANHRSGQDDSQSNDDVDIPRNSNLGSNTSGNNLPVRLPGCHGANCHRHAPLAPLSDPTGESNATQQQWAVWNAQVGSQGLTPGLWIADTPIHLSEGHFARLERPPRSAG